MQNTIWGLEDASYRSTHQFHDWPVMAITWYVTTGRSTRSFDKALAKANPDKLTAFILKSSALADDEIIIRCKSYLRRYCGLSE